MEAIRDIGIAVTICAVVGFGVSKGARYARQRVLGFTVGLLCGLLVILPFGGWLFLRMWPDAPGGVVDALIVACILYEFALWARIARHAETSPPDSKAHAECLPKRDDSPLCLLDTESTPLA